MSFFKVVQGKTSRLVNKLRSPAPSASDHSPSNSLQPPRACSVASNNWHAPGFPTSSRQSSSSLVTIAAPTPSRPQVLSPSNTAAGPSSTLPASSFSLKNSYVKPPLAHSPLSTTGSVIHEVLDTLRNGSDLFLPLKSALVLVVKIWDVFEVRFCDIHP